MYTYAGTDLPIIIDRTRLDFGDSTIDLTLYSVNEDTASVRLILSRSRPFRIQCGASQSDDGSAVTINCFPTVPESQTVTGLQYSINGAEKKFSGSGEDLPVSISVADLNVGQENTFLLILTGSDFAELTISLSLQVQGEIAHASHSKQTVTTHNFSSISLHRAFCSHLLSSLSVIDIPPQCMRTIDGNIMNISCVEGSTSISSYQIWVNGAAFQSGECIHM